MKKSLVAVAACLSFFVVALPGYALSANADLIMSALSQMLGREATQPAFVNPFVSTTIVINEIDYDQVGTDTAEYVELKNISAGPINLDNYSLELVNGNAGGAAVYDTIDLPNVSLAAGDYYVICANATTVINCDLDDAPDTDFVQNGAPDAVGLRLSGVLIDAVSYEGNTGAPYTEGTGVPVASADSNTVAFIGISRFADGSDTDNNSVDLTLRCITPGTANLAASTGCTAPVVTPVLIRQIQGATHRSPLESTMVTAVPGIVTAKTSNGFYMQDPSPDANDATSEGIFVFTTSAPTVNVGDAVSVNGTVTEFRSGGGASPNLTVTEITSPIITVNSTGNSLPPAVIVGTGGRIPPVSVIDDDATGDVETSGTFDPATDGIDFYESLEGMNVQVNNPVAVGLRNQFGELPVIGDNGANASVRTVRGGVVVRPTDFNPERIILDDLLVASSTPTVNVGDTFSGPAIGVVDYVAGNFHLRLTQSLTAVSGGIAAESTVAQSTNQLAIATFNMENLDPGDVATFPLFAAQVVNNLKSPDIIVVQEIQDNNGPTNDSTVDAATTFNDLINAIVTAGGPTYSFRQINPVDDQDGGEPGGNIRIGFLFRTDRGVAFIDRAGGTSTAATTVVNNGGVPELSFSPGRIDPTNTAFNAARKPLAGEFTFQGQKIFVIGNHFVSKGGDQPLFGRFQPPTLSSDVQRTAQAQVVNDFVDGILAVNASAKIAVVGDLNDFEFSNPVSTLKGGVLTNLTDALPQNERYTFLFEGNSQALEHILLSTGLSSLPTAHDIVHVAAEFATQTTDHDPQVARLTFPSSDTNPPTVSYTALANILSPANRVFNVTATDDIGVTGVTVVWENNGGLTGSQSNPCSLTGGTPQDGTWQCTILAATGTPPQTSPGTVTYFVSAQDAGTNTTTNPMGASITAGRRNLFTVGFNGTIDVSILNTFETLSVGNGFTLNGNAIVFTNLALNGILDTGPNRITLECSATATGGGEANYVVGELEKLFCGVSSFTFNVGGPQPSPLQGTHDSKEQPVATETSDEGLAAPEGVVLSNYSPLAVTITAGTVGSSLTVRVFDNTLAGFDPARSVSRNWSITESGNLTANLAFTYRNEDVNGNEADYRLFRYAGAGIITNMCPSAPCVNAGTNTASVSNVSDFSRWAIAENLVPTAAQVSLSGRVSDAFGYGISGAQMTIEGGSLVAPRTTRTNSFGYYTFNRLAQGTYVVSVSSRRFTFIVPSRTFTMHDNITDADFVAGPSE